MKGQSRPPCAVCGRLFTLGARTLYRLDELLIIIPSYMIKTPRETVPTRHSKDAGYEDLKQKVYDLLDPAVNTGWGKVVNYLIISLIFLNTAAVILETVDEFNEEFHVFLRGFDLVSVFIFSIEYVLRLWSCTANIKFHHPVYGRLRYMFTVGALIDLFAILPFYLHTVAGADLRFIRTLRLMLFFRFLKLGRYLTASRVIGRVIRNKREELTVSLLLTFFLIKIISDHF